MNNQGILSAVDRQLSRSNRRIYWVMLAALLGFESWASAGTTNPILWVLLIFPWIALYGIRLHDFGRSAWWGIAALALMGLFVALASLIAPDAVRAASANRSMARVPEQQIAAFTVLMGAAVVLFAGFTILLGIKRGDPAPNRYGAPVNGWGMTRQEVRETITGFIASPLWLQLVLAAMVLLLGGGIVYGWWRLLADLW